MFSIALNVVTRMILRLNNLIPKEVVSMFATNVDRFTAIVRKSFTIYNKQFSVTVPKDTVLITQKAPQDRVKFMTANENNYITGTISKTMAKKHLVLEAKIVPAPPKSPLDSIELEREAGVAPPA